jgi:hypothetical protein
VRYDSDTVDDVTDVALHNMLPQCGRIKRKIFFYILQRVTSFAVSRNALARAR